jgi:hypothetical protein
MDSLQRTLEAHAITRRPKHHFFGYYDKQQWDATGRYILGLEVEFIDRPPEPEDVAVVGMVDTAEGNRFIPLDETTAWNWQQGCMLQWLGSAAERLIIYNAREGDRYVSRIRDVRSSEALTLPRPIYAVSRDGTQAVSLNFSRLGYLRPGYGYVGVPDPWEGDPHPAEDGIYWMDLASGESRLIITLEQMARVEPHPTMEGATQRFNHLLINPDGTRFIFLHRWGRRPQENLWHRMFTANLDGSGIHMVVDGMVSHFEWRDPRHILAWARQKGRGDHYYLIEDQKGRLYGELAPGPSLLRLRSGQACGRGEQGEWAEVVGEEALTCDGHCSYSPDGRWILTDTYPDVERMRTLILYRAPEGPRVDIGRFYAPPWTDVQLRCDLHPRWSRDGWQVCFDSLHEGERQMYVVDVRAVVGGQ